jgi:hypothetical protein
MQDLKSAMLYIENESILYWGAIAPMRLQIVEKYRIAEKNGTREAWDIARAESITRFNAAAEACIAWDQRHDKILVKTKVKSMDISTVMSLHIEKEFLLNGCDPMLSGSDATDMTLLIQNVPKAAFLRGQGWVLHPTILVVPDLAQRSLFCLENPAAVSLIEVTTELDRTAPNTGTILARRFSDDPNKLIEDKYNDLMRGASPQVTMAY